MGDGDNVYKQRVRTELGRDGVGRKLVRIAKRWRQGRHDAEDLAQSAIVSVLCDDDSKWDPDGETSFLKHVSGVSRKLANRERRSYRAKNEVADANVDERAGDPAPLADEALDQARTGVWLDKVKAAMLSELDERDPHAAAVFRAMLDGLGRTAVAERLGCPADDVRLAQDRIRYRLRTLLDRERKADRLHAHRETAANVMSRGALS